MLYSQTLIIYALILLNLICHSKTLKELLVLELLYKIILYMEYYLVLIRYLREMKSKILKFLIEIELSQLL